jgi:hypothetical protein
MGSPLPVVSLVHKPELLNQEVEKDMNLKRIALAVFLPACAAGIALAQDHDRKVPHLDHVFVIMMENHYYSQVLGNANAPFITGYAKSANLATNYFAVGHPSLTNYLEVIGGSNFGIINDDSPDWHNTSCVSNIELGQAALESAPTNTCPIAGTGLDGATPAVDTTNEGTVAEPIYNTPIDPAKTIGISIGDQLVEAHMSWKSYQEDLPPYGADGVDNSDGLLSNLTEAAPGVPNLYAVKHNPFVYFASVQSGEIPENSLKNVVSLNQLDVDLAKGHVPDLAFIVPNQCHDMHGRGSTEVGPGCSIDANNIAQGDAAVKALVTGIKSSKLWKEGNNVIVTVWDENDYSSLPNQVVTIVDTSYAPTGISSNVPYNHFSLLKTLETGFGLSYLNHAADKNVKVMSDLFSGN